MAEPVPIAFGITELNVGGAEKALVQLVTRLDRSRWRPTVVSLQPLGPLAQILSASGISVESLDMRFTGDVLRGLSRWRKILCRDRPRVLVSFLFHANWLGRIAAWRAGVPVHVSSVRVAERGIRWHAFLDRPFARLSQHYVCVSQGVADFTGCTLGIAAERISVIANGVSLEPFDRSDLVDTRPFDIADDDPVLLFVGRLCAQKNPELALESFARCRKLPGHARCRLVFVGDGPMKAMLISRAQDLGIAPSVRFVGWQEDVAAWLRRSDGLVLSSRWEGMPNVILEAMAARRSVIASDVEGVRDLVVPGETGWIAKDGEALADAVGEWLADGDRRARFGEVGRRRVEESFTIDQTVRKWESLLDGLIAKAGVR